MTNRTTALLTSAAIMLSSLCTAGAASAASGRAAHPPAEPASVTPYTVHANSQALKATSRHERGRGAALHRQRHDQRRTGPLRLRLPRQPDRPSLRPHALLSARRQGTRPNHRTARARAQPRHRHRRLPRLPRHPDRGAEPHPMVERGRWCSPGTSGCPDAGAELREDLARGPAIPRERSSRSLTSRHQLAAGFRPPGGSWLAACAHEARHRGGCGCSGRA